MRHSNTRLEHAPRGGAGVQAFAPGRVNLIGEHTDYNDGLCLPFALERGVTVTAEPAAGGSIEVHALDLDERDSFQIGAEGQAREGWRALVRGAAAELQAEGIGVVPSRLTIAADLPAGAGLSSSAAVCVALCLALCEVSNARAPGRMQLARLCSRIENDWTGAQTGLLDQLASLHGEAGHAVRIDMRGPRLRAVPLSLGDHVLAVLDSRAPRDLAETG